MRRLYAYTKRDTCPVELFFEKLNPKIKKKLLFQLNYITDERNCFAEPYVKHFVIPRYKMMYELRVKAAERMVRIIFYERNGDIVLLHAFYKYDRKDTEKGMETAYRILESIIDKSGNVLDEYKKEVVLCDKYSLDA